LHNELDSHVPLEQLDVGMLGHGVEQSSLNFVAGDVSRVHDSARPVTSFAPQIVATILAPTELRPYLRQPTNGGGPAFHAHPYGIKVRQSVARLQRVALVLRERILVGQYR